MAEGRFAMQADEAAEQLREIAESEDAESRDSNTRFRNRAALAIALIAMLLAVANLGGDNASADVVNSNIHASDTFAFFQAKNIRQNDLRVAANELELLTPSLPPDQQAVARRRIEDYQATAARYESEPDPADPDNLLKGEGKQQLLAQGQDWQAKRDVAQQRDPNFDYSSALYQIAIVLGTVAILAVSRAVFAVTAVLGVVATVLMLNGFFLWFTLPIG